MAMLPMGNGVGATGVPQRVGCSSSGPREHDVCHRVDASAWPGA